MRKIELPRTLSLIIWLVLAPALLFALGVWQADRAAETLSQSSQSTERLAASLSEVEKIAATQPNAILSVQTEQGTRKVDVLTAQSQLKKALSQAEQDREISAIRAPFPWGTMGGAVLAFLGGLIGLATSTVSGLSARRSRDHLIRGFARLHAVLPFILATLVIGICVSAVCGSVFEAISIWLWADFSAGSSKLFVLALCLAGLAAYTAYLALRGLRNVFTLFTPETMDVFGRRVTPAEAPELFSFVEDLARRQETALPDTIVVGLTRGFFVTEGHLRLWPEDTLVTGRTLYLPAPYLELLDRAEVAAIIGHELAHFSGKDTVYSQRFAPIYTGLWRSLIAVESIEGGDFVLYPAVILGRHAFQQFDHAVNHWSRLREFEADRNGAHASSTTSVASALIRTGLITAPLEHRLASVAERPQADEDPASPFDLVADTAELVRNHGWPDPLPLLEDKQPHPTDTHPPTIQRIEVLGLKADDALLRLATRPPAPSETTTVGAALFPAWKALCRQLSDDYLGQVRRAQAEHRKALEALAAAVPEETIVYDNVKPMIWAMAIIAVVFTGFGLMVTMFSAKIGFGHDVFAQRLVGGIAAVGVLFCAGYAFYLSRSAARPLMILTPAGLRAAILDSPVAWADIDAHQVVATSRFSLRLLIGPSATLPGKKWYAIRSKIDRKRRIVSIGALGIRGMKAAEFDTLVERYRAAAYALEELSRTT